MVAAVFSSSPNRSAPPGGSLPATSPPTMSPRWTGGSPHGVCRHRWKRGPARCSPSPTTMPSSMPSGVLSFPNTIPMMNWRRPLLSARASCAPAGWRRSKMWMAPRSASLPDRRCSSRTSSRRWQGGNAQFGGLPSDAVPHVVAAVGRDRGGVAADDAGRAAIYGRRACLHRADGVQREMLAADRAVCERLADAAERGRLTGAKGGIHA